MYDVIIIGAGPAGLSAGIYAGRAGLSTLIIEKAMDGGQITTTDSIENYPGQLLENEDGFSLTDRMVKQCRAFGCEKARDTVKELSLEGPVKTVTGTKGVYEGKTVILAVGTDPRPIGCEGEEEFKGRGVSYCATCDGALFRGLTVYVIGGGDAAVEEAMFLTRFAKKVWIIHRRSELRAAKTIQAKAFANEKIGFLWDSVVTKLGGDGVLQSITVKNVKTGEETTLAADETDGRIGVFGFIGRIPQTAFLAGSGLAMDERGFIPADEEMRTNLPGVFAAGDARVKTLRQVITAAADGAIAATSADRYISEQ